MSMELHTSRLFFRDKDGPVSVTITADQTLRVDLTGNVYINEQRLEGIWASSSGWKTTTNNGEVA